MCRQAETIADSSSSEVQIITETQNEREIQALRQTMPDAIAETVQETTLSDTTGSTPDIFRSPVTETVEAVLDKVSIDLSLYLVPFRSKAWNLCYANANKQSLQLRRSQ